MIADSDDASPDATRSRLIAEIYEVVLRPERYDSFMQAWEDHVASHFGSLENGGEPLPPDQEIEDHFRRVFDILERMGRTERAASSPEEAVLLSEGVALAFSSSGRLVAAHPQAAGMFGDIRVLEDLLPLLPPEEAGRLKRLCLGVDRPGVPLRPEAFSIAMPAATGANEGIPGVVLARAVQFGNSVSPILLLEAPGAGWQESASKLLSRQFGLTEAEVAVVRDINSGFEIPDIAARRGRSVHTVRVQIKSALRKTGARSQTDLVRLVAMFARYGVAEAESPQRLPGLARNREIRAPMPDGRMLPVQLLGPAGGRPALFIHGMLDGVAINVAVADALAEADICLVAPIRPHFGGSPPTSAVADAPARFADDIAAVMRHIGLNRVPVVGHMAGAVFAYAAAASLGGAISGIVNVSGGVPILSARQFAVMSRRQRLVAWTARFAPALLPAILRAGIAQIDRGAIGDFMNSLYPLGTLDRQVVADPAIRNAIYDGYRFAVAQGHKAFEIDSRHVTRDWSEYVASTSQPVTLVHGVHDPVVHIDSVRDFAARHANLTLVEEAMAGQLVFYSRPHAVLSRLERFLSATADPPQPIRP